MQKWAIGVDLGGTKIEVGLVNDEGKLLDRLRTPTPDAHTPDSIVKEITTIIKKLQQAHPDISPTTIGIGVAGQIEKNTGIVKYAPNLDWHNVNLEQLLKDELHKPVAVCNDVKAAAWGEWLHGAGKGMDSLLCVFVGTGIGGAIVSNGQMLEGCNNTAGEIGHMTILLNGPACHCGNKGCFEALAGGWAIERDAQQAVKNDAGSGAMLLQLADGDIKKINGKTVAAAAQKGDALANKIIDDLVGAITAGLVSAINLLGPCKVILGGGVIEGMPELVARVEKEMSTRALQAAIEKVALVPAQLHNDSGVVGAAAYALQAIKNTKNK